MRMPAEATAAAAAGTASSTVARGADAPSGVDAAPTGAREAAPRTAEEQEEADVLWKVMQWQAWEWAPRQPTTAWSRGGSSWTAPSRWDAAQWRADGRSWRDYQNRQRAPAPIPAWTAPTGAASGSPPPPTGPFGTNLPPMMPPRAAAIGDDGQEGGRAVEVAEPVTEAAVSANAQLATAGDGGEVVPYTPVRLAGGEARVKKAKGRAAHRGAAPVQPTAVANDASSAKPTEVQETLAARAQAVQEVTSESATSDSSSEAPPPAVRARSEATAATPEKEGVVVTPALGGPTEATGGQDQGAAAAQRSDADQSAGTLASGPSAVEGTAVLAAAAMGSETMPVSAGSAESATGAAADEPTAHQDMEAVPTTPRARGAVGEETVAEKDTAPAATDAEMRAARQRQEGAQSSSSSASSTPLPKRKPRRKQMRKSRE